jgi:hypothetical protein
LHGSLSLILGENGPSLVMGIDHDADDGTRPLVRVAKIGKVEEWFAEGGDEREHQPVVHAVEVGGRWFEATLWTEDEPIPGLFF